MSICGHELAVRRQKTGNDVSGTGYCWDPLPGRGWISKCFLITCSYKFNSNYQSRSRVGLLVVTVCIFYFSRYSDYLRAGRPRGRSSSPGTVKNFLPFTSSKPALGFTQPPIQWVPGALSPGLQLAGREADHSPPTTTEAKKTWIYTPTPLYAFMA
jgi:hypothetical protein